jgi:phosphoglycerol transferase MdoB-like AlkP superfamily enzyme
LNHFVIPHSPDVLAADCSYDAGGHETSQLEQSACATKLLVDFVDRLKELGRFNNSLVIAHADHGVYQPDNDAENPAERVSLRALLLIKPIGSDGDLAVSEVESTVIDIAPTLLNALQVEHRLPVEGSSLLEAMPGARLLQME